MISARGFGMRVVGGKTGADGRLFAYIVWTVPGGPAEKGGLQQGDKVSTIYKTISNKWNSKKSQILFADMGHKFNDGYSSMTIWMFHISLFKFIKAIIFVTILIYVPNG